MEGCKSTLFTHLKKKKNFHTAKVPPPAHRPGREAVSHAVKD